MKNVFELLKGNSYPGRGILLGCGEDGRAVLAYFIMGRSENSRNRVFSIEGDSVSIYPRDDSKVEDPSLIIYSPVRTLGQNTIVTNGDQTDTVYDALNAGGTFEQALFTRRFEPDAPNFTPRISGLISREGKGFTYALSILKAGDAAGATCRRQFFRYEPVRGTGHLIHTYMGDAAPLPSFAGEPAETAIVGGIDELAQGLWKSLDESNRISLYVRYTHAASGEYEHRLINRYERIDRT